jgi:hypothetical protein
LTEDEWLHRYRRSQTRPIAQGGLQPFGAIDLAIAGTDRHSQFVDQAQPGSCNRQDCDAGSSEKDR